MSNHQSKRLTRRNFLGELAASARSAATADILAAAAAFADPGSAPIGPRTAREQVKIGVVGGGFGASFQWHLDPNCKVTAVCDLR